MNIYIVILNWNGKQDTLDCLHSLSSLQGPFKTIVVDNGSTDDSVEAIQTCFPEILIIKTGQNLGFSEGNNWGIRRALTEGAEAIFLLNNDTIVDPELLQAFLQAARTYPQVGILGAKNYLFNSTSQLDHFGGMWDKNKGTFRLVGYRDYDHGTNWDSPQLIDYACGCSLFIKKEVFEKIGLFEPRFFLLWEESDFCFRAKNAGFLTMTCPQAKIWHKVSASFSGKPHSTYFWWRNRLLWIERNCSSREKWRLAFQILLPEILHLVKITCLKRVQNFFSPTPERLIKEKNMRAALCGIKDYIFRRFGNASLKTQRNWQ